MSSFQLPQNPSSPTPNPMTAGTRYASSPNQSLYSGLGDRLRQQSNGMRSSANQVLSLENQVNMIAQECTQYPDGSVQKQDCMRRLQDIVQRRDAQQKAIKDVTLPASNVRETKNPYGSTTAAPAGETEDEKAAREYEASITSDRSYKEDTGAPTASTSSAPAATPSANMGYGERVTSLKEKEQDILRQLEDERGAYAELLNMGNADRGVLRASELRINNLMSQLRGLSGDISRYERLDNQETIKKRAAESHATWLADRRARVAAAKGAASAGAPGAMPYSERGPGDQTGVQSAPEMTRITPGMTGTQFGPMLGKFSPAQSASRGAMDPYELALYEGTITPEEYRRLTGDGMEQPGVSDYENALNVMTGHAQYKGRTLPAQIDLPTRAGWSNVPGSPAFRLPANQMEPMSRPRQTESSPGPVPPGARTPGPSFAERETARFQADGLMPNPQQALEALNMAEARLSLGQIGPAEAGELQRIRQLKQRLIEDMARRQRGIF